MTYLAIQRFLRRSLVRASNRALRFNESFYFLSSPPPFMNGQIQAMCQRLPSIGRGGSAKEKKGLLVEIVETFSLSLAHER